jgi:hypothetical protein
MSSRERKAKQRTPSNFGSNNQPSRENAAWLSVASMGDTQAGLDWFRSSARPLNSLSAPGSILDMLRLGK